MRLINTAIPLNDNRLFVYSVPDHLLTDNIVGRRVLVSFGKRILTAVVVEDNVKSELTKIKPIIEFLDNEPVFTNELLKLTKWISDYYLASWGDTLKAALPQGMSPKSIVNIKILKHLSESEIKKLKKKAPKKAEILRLLYARGNEVSVKYLQSQLKNPVISSQLEVLENTGYIYRERVMQKSTKEKTQKAVLISDNLIKDEDKFKEKIIILDKKAPKQAIALNYLYVNQKKTYKAILLSELMNNLDISISAINSLAKKNLVNIVDIKIERIYNDGTGNNLSIRNEAQLELTNEQKTVLKEVKDKIKSDCYSSILIHGITGSGKTLIYLHAIQEILDKGKSALILVPEISLTPQLIDRFERVFQDKIAVLHSRMSEGEKYDTWQSIRTGKKQIVLGVRSAVFAPLKNLGLIIVDEEHETSYKQDNPSPRYHARDTAIMRARIENALIILGSATPSLESYYNATKGKYKLLNIFDRADGAVLPDVKIIDIMSARKRGQMHGYFSEDLLNEIAERVRKKEGVILFQNRRGFATVLECPDCGYVPECDNCSVPLTYHKKIDNLQCHYCGKTYKKFNSCPACGYPQLKEIGYGTQRIEENIKTCLEERNIKARVQRMDLDTTARKGSYRKIIADFARGDIDILIGTQMVAKGLDIARVTLVGVINADLQLYLPDFRASERTFQLLTQVSGRAGRTMEQPGEVIIQTSHPSNFAILSTKNNDFNLFYNEEIDNRKNAEYPPFYRFVVIEFFGKNQDKVNKQSSKFFSILPKNYKGITFLGPVTPSIYKIRNNYRKIIIAKLSKETDPNSNAFRKIMNYAFDKYNKQWKISTVSIKIDVDSYSII